MIRRKWRKTEVVEDGPKGFDDYDFRLGDEMRGERATMGKSLLDVQRELRIKASYIAAIENADPSAFETQGFIAGYVRSYARYLNMDPDATFEKFCLESGFQTAHGMSSEASGKRKTDAAAIIASADRDPFSAPAAPFIPAQESILARIEPRAIGSSLVLLALIAGIGYGGWSVLNEVQRVSLAPVEQTPVVLSDLDPLNEATATPLNGNQTAEASGVFTPPENTLDRLYRPQALDVPVLTARDAPISTLNPQSVGSFVPDAPSLTVAESTIPATPIVPQVLEDAEPEVVMIAVRPAWVRVRSADGSVLFEGTLNAGDEFVVPNTEISPTLQAGMSGSIYFQLNGEIRGPVGQGTSVVRNVPIGIDEVQDTFSVADISGDEALADFVAVAAAQSVEVSE
ncbi:helix-turn-helix domain-containing protein [Cognatishimia activa]|uniref:Cytoskeletal protein RodZ n=1 Tax=Cognatishimia activa TaxID=1715691 RepID=A0A0P1IP09_9RHOB|nr:helix-turn-helix domain-containing protein [Cognatishimia activa]CUJ28775.1 cytoskeletal protein RodZ [Cognatishimia activa]CUK25242.1 cytoskeletal protein RodZ [Cognatishimia activa]